MKKLTLLLLLLSVLTTAKAQDPTYRCEIGIGGGMSNYIGDFNTSLVKNMQPALEVIFRRVINPWCAVKVDASWSKFKGSSADVTTYYPEIETGSIYEFNRTMIDCNATFEYNFLPYGTGMDYRGAKKVVPFIFLGLGFTSATGGEKANAMTANIPIGLGVKYKVHERVNLGLEWAMHFSFSDNLDGMKDPYGIESSGFLKNTDCYSSLRFTVTYSFSKKCPTCNKDE